MERFETELSYPSSYTLYSYAYRERLEREAARLQAETVGRGLAALGRGIGAVFRGAFRLLAMIVEGSAAVRLYEELSHLDDAALADLGIRREEIGRYVVDSMDRALKRDKAVPSDAGLSAIDGGRRELPVHANESLPHRRAA